MLNRTYTAVLGVAVGATALAGAVSVIPRASATTGTAGGATSSTATVTVPSACTLSGGQTHSATINNGQTGTIGTSTLKAICNDLGGFSIYAVGYGNNEIGNTVLHSDTLATTHDIPTGTSGSGSYWSMSLAKVTGNYEMEVESAFDQTAHVVPESYTRVAYRTAITDATEGSSVNATYSAHVSQTQSAGTYTGKVKYVLIHPSGTTPPATNVMQDVADWKGTMLTGETYIATDNRDGKSYYVTKMEDGNVWMTQNLDLCIGCDGVDDLTSENTDLHTSGSGIYAEDYEVTNDVIKWKPTVANTNATVTGTPATITNFTSGNPANSVSGWTNSATEPYMTEGGEHWVANNIPYSSLQDCVDANGIEMCNHKHVGNYYNYTAAVASSSSTAISDRYATADNSICPKGWRLPEGPDGTNGSEYNTLLTDAGIIGTSTDESHATFDPGTGTRLEFNYTSGGRAKMEGLPYAFGRFGGVDGTTFYGLAYYGYYWSGSTVSSSDAFYLLYYGSYAYPADQDFRDGGWSVRCVAR